ncbi:MarR family winged helix-turn-helix transcriptional regulator [Paenibacillus sp. YN15]|uniref:MarR family winged helix-turn-helix transcriptional regulator n=1 Tax=Paenibacillus sp. YN15 TaxID=1742774 RepID=UPI000DCCDB65|nr:MarR family transcriptional regulator [Paenibacillus sp. YN15]RAV05106.1 MarR family transcriptional regulator [Paenibacillus sp. YN15]
MAQDSEDLIERFHTANLRFRRGFECRLLQRMGPSITAPQMYVLFYVKRKGKCKLSDIADKVEVKPSAVTVMIDRMERAGYVVRRDDPADRRSILVELTASGEEMLEQAVSHRNDIIRDYFSRLEPEERRALTELLEKMAPQEKE